MLFVSSQVANAARSLYPTTVLTMLIGPASCIAHSSRYVTINEGNLCLIVHFILLYQRD